MHKKKKKKYRKQIKYIYLSTTEIKDKSKLTLSTNKIKNMKKIQTTENTLQIIAIYRRRIEKVYEKERRRKIQQTHDYK